MSLSSCTVRNYETFHGVDLRSEYGYCDKRHSPYMINMYTDYSSGAELKTRPGIKYCSSFSSFIDSNNKCKLIQFGEKVLVRAGQYLIWWKNFPKDIGTINTSVTSTTSYYIISASITSRTDTGALDTDQSWYVIQNGKLYIYEGACIYIYNGSTITSYKGGISFYNAAVSAAASNINVMTDNLAPIRYINCNANGSGTSLQPRNLLSPCCRVKFTSDGSSTVYSMPYGWKVIYYQKDSSTPIATTGLPSSVTFPTAPAAGTQITCLCRYGEDEISGAGEGTEFTQSEKRVSSMTLSIEFDHRIFRAGSTISAYSSMLIHSMPNDPLYFADTSYYYDSDGTGSITALLPTSEQLAVIKSSYDGHGSIYLHTPQNTSDELMPKIYPSTYCLYNAGCVNRSCFATFNDVPVFLSRNGLTAITSKNLTGERQLSHRSTLCDRVLLSKNLSNAKMCVWNNYLVICSQSDMFLADGLNFYNDYSTSGNEYEWYLFKQICTWTKNNLDFSTTETPDSLFSYKNSNGQDILCFTTVSGKVYMLDSSTETDISADNTSTKPIFCCIATPSDDFGYPHMLKKVICRTCNAKLDTSGLVAYYKTTGKYGELKYNPFYFSDSDQPSMVFRNLCIKKIETVYDCTDSVICKFRHKPWYNISIIYTSHKPITYHSSSICAYVTGKGKGD